MGECEGLSPLLSSFSPCSIIDRRPNGMNSCSVRRVQNSELFKMRNVAALSFDILEIFKSGERGRWRRKSRAGRGETAEAYRADDLISSSSNGRDVRINSVKI